MMLREKNGQSKREKRAGARHNSFHPRASAGSARGSRKPSKDLRPVPAGVQGEGPGTRCPAAHGVSLMGKEGQRRDAHAVLTGDTGRAQNPLRFISHIRVMKHPSPGVGEE